MAINHTLANSFRDHYHSRMSASESLDVPLTTSFELDSPLSESGYKLEGLVPKFGRRKGWLFKWFLKRRHQMARCKG